MFSEITSEVLDVG